MTTVLIILLRVIASPLANVFQKRLTNREISPELIVMSSYLFFAILAIPVLFFYQPFYFSTDFWVYILLLGLFDVIGNMYLVKSLRSIDLSLFGPLNSFKPVFALVIGGILLSEIPSVFGILGVVVIIAGTYVINYDPNRKVSDFDKMEFRRGLFFRFLAIALTSIAAVFSKKTIILSSPLITLAWWSIIGLPISIYFVAKQRDLRSQISELRIRPTNLIFLFASFLVLQLSTLFTFERIFVGYSLAFFQLSSIISVLFGYYFFKERNIRNRLIGSLIMIIGALLIIWFG